MSRDILLSLVDPDPEQPRKHFDSEQLGELAQSIAANGLAVPILVRPAGERYTIVHGERRYRAALSLGWETIAADVRDIAPDAAPWLALIENIQRADLSPIEEARAYRARLDAGMTQQALGERIGKSQSYIAQKLRLLTLPDALMLYLSRNILSEGHARQLLRLRGMYGDEITVTLDPSATVDWLNREDVTPDNRVTMLMVTLRIEDEPNFPFYTDDVTQAQTMLAACQSFADYARRRQGCVPLWEMATLWWATLTAYTQLSVADLKTALDAWHGRFLSAIAWWYTCKYGDIKPDPKDKRPVAELHHLMWWGYSSDLRHGRVRPYVEANGLPRNLELEAITYLGKQQSFDLPTQLHPSRGSKYERFKELEAQTAA